MIKFIEHIKNISAEFKKCPLKKLRIHHSIFFPLGYLKMFTNMQQKSGSAFFKKTKQVTKKKLLYLFNHSLPNCPTGGAGGGAELPAEIRK